MALFWGKNLTGVTAVTEVILDRACAIRMQTDDGGVLYFVSVYLPAQGCDESYEASLDDVTEIIESREPYANVVVLGDFNSDIGSRGGPRGVRKATPRGCKLLNFLNRHAMTALNMCKLATGPVDTYMGNVNGTTLDYIALPSQMLTCVTECRVLPWNALNTSDHTPVSAKLKLNSPWRNDTGPPP